jgi:MFS family permease
LFAAQLVALVGTGLATVALGLLAYDLAGAGAGVVLGTALAVKMVAYVLVAPIVGAWADRVPRRALMVGADLVRAGIVVLLPFVTDLWQVYLLIAVLQSASATFTPVFQSVLPDVLPVDADYTRALSASQFAVAAENIVSPLLAAALLTVMTFGTLFLGTAVGFAASAALVLTVAVPRATRSGRSRFLDRVSVGLRVFAAVPALRAIVALDLVVASAGAITLVSTVNVARDLLGGDAPAVASLLAISGAGTAAAAVLAPRLLRSFPERTVMIVGSVLATGATAGAIGVALAPGWPLAAVVWASIGLGTGLTLMPIGRVIRRAGARQDRPAVFAAQFSLSHLCWLLTYPLTGILGTTIGFAGTWTVLLVLAAGAAGAAILIWPRPSSRGRKATFTPIGGGKVAFLQLPVQPSTTARVAARGSTVRAIGRRAEPVAAGTRRHLAQAGAGHEFGDGVGPVGGDAPVAATEPGVEAVPVPDEVDQVELPAGSQDPADLREHAFPVCAVEVVEHQRGDDAVHAGVRVGEVGGAALVPLHGGTAASGFRPRDGQRAGIGIEAVDVRVREALGDPQREVAGAAADLQHLVARGDLGGVDEVAVQRPHAEQRGERVIQPQQPVATHRGHVRMRVPGHVSSPM